MTDNKFSRGNLIKEAASASGVSQAKVRLVLQALEDVAYDHMSKGETVRLFNGLSIGTRYCKSRSCMNFKTKEVMMSKPRMKPMVSFGQKVWDFVSEMEAVER